MSVVIEKVKKEKLNWEKGLGPILGLSKKQSLTKRPVSALGSRVILLPSTRLFSARVPSESCLQFKKIHFVSL